MASGGPSDPLISNSGPQDPWIFFPDLGEPGFWDELFYFGPWVLQLSLGVVIFFVAQRWHPLGRWHHWLAAAIGGVIFADVLFVLLLIGIGPSLFS